jgi:hypothetical protein
MARLADEIWELPWAPPQVLCYKPGLRTEGEGGFSIAQMKSLMEEQRRLVAAALRKCRHHFVQDMRGRSSLIILPGTQ